MSFLGLHITDGSVTGENTDPVAALSNNYQKIDAGIALTQSVTFSQTVTNINVPNAETGMEIAVADGSGVGEQPLWVASGPSTWHKTDLVETWGSWTNIPLAATTPLVIGQAGDLPQWRTSSWGRLELKGTIQPNSGFFTNSVWKLFYDGTVDTSALRAIGNRPASGIAIGATAKYFQVVGTSIPGALPAGALSTCTICVTNDATFTYMQMYYNFSDTTTSPPAQYFKLDGMIWDKAVGGYAGNIV